jgi:hypothetical protein
VLVVVVTRTVEEAEEHHKGWGDREARAGYTQDPLGYMVRPPLGLDPVVLVEPYRGLVPAPARAPYRHTQVGLWERLGGGRVLLYAAEHQVLD